MKRLPTKRIASIFLTAAMVSTFTAGSVLAFAQKNTPVSGNDISVTAENVTGKIDLTGVALNQLSPSVIENTESGSSSQTREATIIVTLGDGVASHTDDVAQYLTTSAGKSTMNDIERRQRAFLSALLLSGISYEYVDSYSTVVNAVAIRTNTVNESKIRAISNVEGVAISRTYQTADAERDEQGAVVNPNYVYGTGIYDSSSFLAESDGSGIVVAVLDSGFDYTHEAFEKTPDTLAMDFDMVEEKLDASFAAARRSASAGVTLTARDVYVSDKIPFAYDYADDDADVYPSYSNHGTHVAGIIAGQADSYQDKDGVTPEYDDGTTVPFRGVAPEAQLVLMKVFTDDLDSKDIGGATTEDIVAALEDCTKLGVDIVNMSLGTVAGFSTNEACMVDDEGKLLQKYYTEMHEKGIALYAAASNDFSSGFGSEFGTNLASNPDSGTVGSPSTFIGAMSVASVNGQRSPYLKAGATADRADIAANGQAVFFLNSSDANMVQYDFVEEMLTLTGGDSALIKFVMIPGTGRAVDYTSSVLRQLSDKTANGTPTKVVAVIKRGGNTFKEKIETAMEKGADAVVVYNNVAGTVRMNLGELTDPVPTMSITMDAGAQLNTLAKKNGGVGYFLVDRSYEAGPFMNDYSSWGVSPDLRLKPDITAHGGEITSCVPGGYAEMSGTSMATPNLAGFAALLRSSLKKKHPSYSAEELTELSNQLIMSTAALVYDEEGLAYSPRKQGAGLAVLKNVFNTNAYLSHGEGWVEGEAHYFAEENRPKAEFRDDKNKTGVYHVCFRVNNTSGESLSFDLKSVFMTETLASDKLAVAEAAYLLNSDAVFTASGGGTMSGATLTVSAKSYATVTATLTLTAAEKRYIESSFPNGMFVEGFIRLLSKSEAQCDLIFPFVGFYGDWEQAPLLDYDCYEIAASEKDTSVLEADKLKPSVWATQAYGVYYNEKYSVPLGSYLYVQDEDADQIYTEEEHAAISRYNLYYGADGESSYNNYMTTTGIKALYVGLLRNCEMATYKLYDEYTGELIKEDTVYRLSKAYANGGSSVPSQLLLEMYPEEMGFAENGKYRMEFSFFRTVDIYEAQSGTAPEENTFSMVFYVDYSSPVLVDQRVRYYDYKENNKDKQRVYLDLDIYDNHYAQSVMLCYLDEEASISKAALKLATEYVTPVYNAKKNGTTTVSIDVTDFYEQYNGRLYIQIDDYALNHSVYRINFSTASSGVLPDEFHLRADGSLSVDKDGNGKLTLGVNDTYKVALDYAGSANLSNFDWETTGRAVKVKNGEIFAAEEGTQIVYVSAYLGNREISKAITVTVTAGTKTSVNPTFSFGVIQDSSGNLVKATGTVKVNPGDEIILTLLSDPWYYEMDGVRVEYTSSNLNYATVSNSDFDPRAGVVSVGENEKRGNVTISALIYRDDVQIGAARVTFNVQEPFLMSSTTLVSYHGNGGARETVTVGGETLSLKVLRLPDDHNIMSIGEEAFKDCDEIEMVVIPKTVTQISERAFLNCSSLRVVSFLADSDLNLIYRDAFKGCSNLEILDLSNNKVITVAQGSFRDTALRKIVDMNKIGTAYDEAFRGTKLTLADISSLHVAGSDVFRDCNELTQITTSYHSAIGTRMFYDCALLTSVEILSPKVGESAFENSGVTAVTFTGDSRYDYEFEVDNAAFRGCNALERVDFCNYRVYRIGDEAFANCAKAGFTVDNFNENGRTLYGRSVFSGSSYRVNGARYYESDGKKTLTLAPESIVDTEELSSLLDGVSAIGSYAFSSSKLQTAGAISLPAGVETLGEGAFENMNITGVSSIGGVTEIPARAFRNSAVASLSLNHITGIGEQAFSGCGALTALSDADGVTNIGDSAFSGCVALGQISLENTKSVGSFAFAGCTALTQARLSALERAGSYMFTGCTHLQSAVFGEQAKTTGEYTFAPSALFNGATLSALTEVSIGNAVEKIGDGAFAYCTNLSSFDLKGVTVIGDGAFMGTKNLNAVTGIEGVTAFGKYAFAGGGLGGTLDLSGAVSVGEGAFTTLSGAALTPVFGDALQTIEDFAFYKDAFAGETVTLPAGVKSVGRGAFAGAKNVASFALTQGESAYFTADGVLYRYLNEKRYELVAYPSAKYRPDKTYTVIDGTVSVRAYAFAETSVKLNKAVLPYSLVTVGDAAFFESGVKEFVFESINAPVLLSEYRDTGIDGLYSLFYLNYGDSLLMHTDLGASGGGTVTPSSLTMSYPTNGLGYDNYLYTYYFTGRKLLGELMDDATRALKELIESLPATAEGCTDKESVFSLSDALKRAHAAYNNIKSATQLEWLGEENIQKLFDLEEAVKPLKATYAYPVNVSSIEIDPDCTYKSEYYTGETFISDGLRLIVYYDDYTQEQADMSKIEIAEEYAGALTPLNLYVTLKGYGRTVQIPVSVTDRGETAKKKINPAVIYAPILGAVVLAGAGVGVWFFLKKRKGKNDKEKD